MDKINLFNASSIYFFKEVMNCQIEISVTLLSFNVTAVVYFTAVIL